MHLEILMDTNETCLLFFFFLFKTYVHTPMSVNIIKCQFSQRRVLQAAQKWSQVGTKTFFEGLKQRPKQDSQNIKV